MKKVANLTLRVDSEVQQKLKIMAAVGNTTMNEIVSRMVMGASLKIPDFGGTAKKKKTKRIIEQGPTSNETEIRPIIEKMRAAGDSFQKIAEHFEAEGTPTLSGRGKWSKATISNLMKRWEGV